MANMLSKSQLFSEEHMGKMMATAEWQYMDAVSCVAENLLMVLDQAMEIMSPYADDRERLRISRAVVAIEDAYNVASDWSVAARDHGMNQMRFRESADEIPRPSPDRRG